MNNAVHHGAHVVRGVVSRIWCCDPRVYARSHRRIRHKMRECLTDALHACDVLREVIAARVKKRPITKGWLITHEIYKALQNIWKIGWRALRQPNVFAKRPERLLVGLLSVALYQGNIRTDNGQVPTFRMIETFAVQVRAFRKLVPGGLYRGARETSNESEKQLSGIGGEHPRKYRRRKHFVSLFA
jgi:hypothetical protein